MMMMIYNRSTLDIGVLGYIVIVQHKEHSPEVLSIPPGTPCIYVLLTFLQLCLYIGFLLLLLLVFSPWAGLGRDQSSVRRLVWLWYAASWASS